MRELKANRNQEPVASRLRLSAPPMWTILSENRTPVAQQPASRTCLSERGGHVKRGFTLTELLIVIAIIAVLAALATAGAVAALRAANRGKITMGIQGVSRAVEDFKTAYGAYPPNAMNPTNTPNYGALARRDVRRMFDTAFPRHNEPATLIDALAGAGQSGGPNLPEGINAAEALYFWLGGFSADEQYPISGPGGPSFLVSTGEFMEERTPNRRYEFDLAQLGPRNNDDSFRAGTNAGDGRFIRYVSPVPGESGAERQINFWQFRPKNSDQPLVYFDVSRHKPAPQNQGGYDTWAANSSTGLPRIYAYKQLRSGATSITGYPDVTFVNQGKYQILHAGLDGLWGSFDFLRSNQVAANQLTPLYPTGPFIGEMGDNLTNFSDGELANAAE